MKTRSDRYMAMMQAFSKDYRDLTLIGLVVFFVGAMEIHALTHRGLEVESNSQMDLASLAPGSQTEGVVLKDSTANLVRSSKAKNPMLTLDLGCLPKLDESQILTVTAGLIQLKGNMCGAHSWRRVISHSVVNQTTSLAAVTFIWQRQQLLTDYIHLQKGLNSFEIRVLFGNERILIKKVKIQFYEAG